jgi:hypothetical protein
LTNDSVHGSMMLLIKQTRELKITERSSRPHRRRAGRLSWLHLTFFAFLQFTRFAQSLGLAYSWKNNNPVPRGDGHIALDCDGNQKVKAWIDWYGLRCSWILKCVVDTVPHAVGHAVA